MPTQNNDFPAIAVNPVDDVAHMLTQDPTYVPAQ
jgi:hypothetical protein